MLNNNEVSSVSAARYVGMTYDAVEIAMPNGAPVPVATTEPVAPTPVSASKPAAAASPAAATAPPPAAAPPARAATPAATDAAGSPADRLKALQQLLDEKLITPEEYDRRRKVILDSL
jgi:hypothetical protein